jgi:hypothetical protein
MVPATAEHHHKTETEVHKTADKAKADAEHEKAEREKAAEKRRVELEKHMEELEQAKNKHLADLSANSETAKRAEVARIEEMQARAKKEHDQLAATKAKPEVERKHDIIAHATQAELQNVLDAYKRKVLESCSPDEIEAEMHKRGLKPI